MVKTTDPALAQSRIGVLEQGLAVLEWTATLRPNSKNRALVGRTRRLAAKAREAVARLPAANTAAAMNGFGSLGLGSRGIDPRAVQPSLSTVPTMPFFPDFNVPKVEPADIDLDVPIHLAPSLGTGAMHSTPSDGAASVSIPWSTGPGGLEMPAEPSFSMPLAPSTNDDQFDAWLAMLFPPVEAGGAGVGPVVGDVAVNDEWSLDPNAWNTGR